MPLKQFLAVFQLAVSGILQFYPMTRRLSVVSQFEFRGYFVAAFGSVAIASLA
jgi:hypothetical protein